MAKEPVGRSTPRGVQPDRGMNKSDGPRKPDKSVKVWMDRLRASHKAYEAWADRFRVKRCEDYLEGIQWAGLAETDAEKRYVVNYTFATMTTQLPTLLFSRPKVTVEPRPYRNQQPGSDASARATLIESLLQTKVEDPSLHFLEHTTLALQDVYSRFGLVEVGYTADYIDNPNAGKPLLKDESSGEVMRDSEDQPVRQPAQTLRSENVYVRQLNPEHFRVSPGRPILEDNDWCAYGEYFHLSDVKANPDYRNTEGLKATGRNLADDGEGALDEEAERLRHVSEIRLWKVWDLRGKVRWVFAEGHDQPLQQKKFKVLNLAALKFYSRRKTWYPIPPVWNWLSPQDEVNEIREMRRVHRRRANRHYLRDPRLTQTEFDKLMTGEDMSCAEVAKPSDALLPVPDAPLDPQSMNEALLETKDDWSQITGSSGESRNTPEADTATQANIMNTRQQIRESQARTLVAHWLGQIARLMLLALQEKMKLPAVVKMSVDPFHPTLAGVGQAAHVWQEIEREQIEGIDVDVKIDVASLSPVTEDAQRTAWNVVLQLMTNQALMLVLMTPAEGVAATEPSPLLRRTLNLNGIKSDAEVREIWRVGQVVLQRMAMMAAAAAAAKSGIPTPGGIMPGAEGGPSPTAGPGGPAAGVPARSPMAGA